MAHLTTILAHCPFCKYGLDALQARAMEYCIYFMLALIYGLIGIIGFKVTRMMMREERELKEKAAREAAAQAPKKTEPVAVPAESSR